MDRKAVWFLALCSVLLLGGSASAITVDGNAESYANEWLTGSWATICALSVPGDPTNDAAFDPSFPPVLPQYTGYFIEDGPGTLSDPGYVGPGSGGQDFDVEAMYYAYLGSPGPNAGDGVYVGIITGFDSTGEIGGGGATYTAGDIFFDIGNDGDWDFAVETTGATAGHVYASLNGDETANWWTNPTSYNEAKPNAIRYSAAVDVTAALGFTPSFGYNNYSCNHNFIEAYVDELLLQNGQTAGYWDGLSYTDDTPIVAHWTQSCGNDVGEVSAYVPPIPEPATMAMLGCLGVGMFVARRVRGKKS